jgi:agmatine deiminase
MKTAPPSGFRMPAEWEPHEATWLSWPHNLETWPGAFERVPDAFAAIVAALHRDEEVRILVGDDALERSARAVLDRRGCEAPNVRFFRIPTDDAWVRDHGPIFLVDGQGELAVTDWIFDSWGRKYGSWDLDDVVPTRIAGMLGLPLYEPGIVLEGGSIDVDGRGALLTTEQCLLNPNRNPQLSRQEIEEALRRFLGVHRVLWLGAGIAGDDTDGHVDDLARFVSPTTVVTVVEEDPADENHRPLRDNLARLRSMTATDGRPLEIVTLPMPRPVHFDDRRLPASYANFYVGNGAVLVPTYDDPADEVACSVLAALFPGRRIARIPCRELVWGLGAAHCVTQQQPARSRAGR